MFWNACLGQLHICYLLYLKFWSITLSVTMCSNCLGWTNTFTEKNATRSHSLWQCSRDSERTAATADYSSHDSCTISLKLTSAFENNGYRNPEATLRIMNSPSLDLTHNHNSLAALLQAPVSPEQSKRHCSPLTSLRLGGKQVFECVYVCGGAGSTMPAQCECCGSLGDTERGTKNQSVGERGREMWECEGGREHVGMR